MHSCYVLYTTSNCFVVTISHTHVENCTHNKFLLCYPIPCHDPNKASQLT
jgi:hypothetical protein